jgi:hypothetical protein
LIEEVRPKTYFKRTRMSWPFSYGNWNYSYLISA